MIHLDTHVAAWLYAGLLDHIPERVRKAVGENEVFVSPMVALELQYLFEIRRVTEPAAAVIDSLGKELGLQLCAAPFPRIVEEAMAQTWTRDPFDRIIVAHAAVQKSILVTKDEHIHRQYPQALWD
ncbi:MAG: PIN domain-containing protein [Thermodesulfobacteriota bacterium]